VAPVERVLPLRIRHVEQGFVGRQLRVDGIVVENTMDLPTS
jgi:hypothetical protein